MIRQCQLIADEIVKPTKDMASFLETLVGVTYFVNSDKECVGAELIIDVSGADVHIDTRRQAVYAYWDAEGTRVEVFYPEDGLGLDNYWFRKYYRGL